jgi:hypothetical protein
MKQIPGQKCILCNTIVGSFVAEVPDSCANDCGFLMCARIAITTLTLDSPYVCSVHRITSQVPHAINILGPGVIS